MATAYMVLRLVTGFESPNTALPIRIDPKLAGFCPIYHRREDAEADAEGRYPIRAIEHHPHPTPGHAGDMKGAAT